MSEADDVAASSKERREQPFLYTWNRRLRHLHGISLRNLNLSPAVSRNRGKTINDDEYNLKSAAKTLVRDEARTLHHAKSYDQLLKPTTDSALSPHRASNTDKHVDKSVKRPMRGTLRRRSTLHWATSSPRTRQNKLEAVEVNRLLTSWFSIHHDELEQPVYISEVMEKSMNPSFSFFDLDTSVTSITRSGSFTLRIWSRNELMNEYKILIELNVDMRSLQFIGRSLDTFHHPLPENCVLLHLSDGIYTSFTDLPAESQHQPPLTAAMKTAIPVQAASFDALIKLANLDDVIQDAIRTRAKLEAGINKLLTDMPASEHALSELASKQEGTRNVKRAREAGQKSIESLTKTISDLRSSLTSRRKAVEKLPQSQQKSLQSCKQLHVAAQKIHKELEGLEEASNGQVRRICTTLLHVYPIEPIKNRTLQFTIRNLPLANSAYDGTNRDEVAAALGYTAQLVHRLSLYLSIPLPYTIEPNEPNSFIRDDVSAGIAQRQFPLQPSGAAYKFEYGVFLLNKDIEFLMTRSGLRVMDIRHTLPNLKYLIFMLTAGGGDLPRRKAGGIRGLLRGFMTPDMSRRNSEESVTSQASTAVSDGKATNWAQQEKAADVDDAFSGPVRARGLPYRRSMLRDAG